MPLPCHAARSQHHEKGGASEQHRHPDRRRGLCHHLTGSLRRQWRGGHRQHRARRAHPRCREALQGPRFALARENQRREGGEQQQLPGENLQQGVHHHALRRRHQAAHRLLREELRGGGCQRFRLGKQRRLHEHPLRGETQQPHTEFQTQEGIHGHLLHLAEGQGLQ